ncbi:hypothetical protein LD001_05815 [Pseudomonas kurunegalensis]|uniref:hypothetical protein n=1 Tax=Pseudomonas kurunegalensis TaxID=485880 RepID=UPI001CDC84D0|nr:hypothetical protein [Pseudomonas kurunegalensis]MCA4074847.1 hypothetical protein [Pseudomonas kurunegalensis]
MHDFLVGLSGAVSVYLYWYMCRKVALPKRELASKEVAAYLDRDDITDSDRNKVGWFYFSMTKWYSLPLMTLIGFPVVLYGIFSGKMEKNSTPSEQDNAMNAAWRMYVVRNPVTTIVCLTMMSCFITLITPFGVLANKVMPSISQVYKTVVETENDHGSKHA